MTFVHEKSLDMSNRLLKYKKRDAINRIKSGDGYMSYVLKASGDLIVYSLDSRVKSGISQKTLKYGNYVFLKNN